MMGSRIIYFSFYNIHNFSNILDLPELPECNEDEVLEGTSPVVESTSPVAQSNFVENEIKMNKKNIRPKKPEKPGRKEKAGRRVKWTLDEKKVVLKFFKNEIKNKVVPGKERCLECKDKHDVLAKRSWQDIKYCIYNYNKTIK